MKNIHIFLISMSYQHPPSVCFYFQVHQPYRLGDLRIVDIGEMHGKGYFDEDRNRAIFRKVAEKCYLPANARLLKMLKRHPECSVAFSLSGVFLDQCKEYGPDVLASFRKLAKTNQVEFLAETYYHSLSCLYSLEEFCMQVSKHAREIKKCFGVTPHVFRNTELVFCNEVAQVARLMGFSGILSEGADRILGGRSPNMPYEPPAFALPAASQRVIAKHRVHPRASKTIRILLKNYRLSDDIAFRFSDRNWSHYPLHADTFADWVAGNHGHSVNLFMDYETFGEHQWADTGIFDFLEVLPDTLLRHGIECKSPSEILKDWGKRPCPVLDTHEWISWADMERDLSAWKGNHLQEAAFNGIYRLEKLVKSVADPSLIETWRKLQTSDHFYYLCTKYWSDGDVHKYFSPYESPYEAYRRYSHAIEDLRVTLEELKMENGKLKIVGVSTRTGRSDKTIQKTSAIHKKQK